MNGDKYRILAENIKNAETMKDKVDDMATMLCMIATNDLPHLWKAIWILVALTALNLLMPEQWNIKALIEWAVRALG